MFVSCGAAGSPARTTAVVESDDLATFIPESGQTALLLRPVASQVPGGDGVHSVHSWVHLTRRGSQGKSVLNARMCCRFLKESESVVLTLAGTGGGLMQPPHELFGNSAKTRLLI